MDGTEQQMTLMSASKRAKHPLDNGPKMLAGVLGEDEATILKHWHILTLDPWLINECKDFPKEEYKCPPNLRQTSEETHLIP